MNYPGEEPTIIARWDDRLRHIERRVLERLSGRAAYKVPFETSDARAGLRGGTTVRILCVEDSELEGQGIVDLLARAGWDTDLVSSAEGAEQALAAQTYDVAIVDWNLPGRLSGIDLCERLRRDGSTMGNIIVTARIELEDKHAAFAAGADDYVQKPFEGRELCDRVRALYRRSRPVESNSNVAPGVERRVTWGPFSVIPGEVLVIEGRECELTPRQQRVFLRLLRNAGRVVTNAEIWEDFRAARSPDPVNIRALIYSLRKRLGREARFIEQLRGVGYGIGVLPDDGRGEGEDS